jgi:hypothetical protein
VASDWPVVKATSSQNRRTRDHAVETLTLADGFAILESVFDIAGVVAAMTEGELGVPE